MYERASLRVFVTIIIDYVYSFCDHHDDDDEEEEEEDFYCPHFVLGVPPIHS